MESEPTIKERKKALRRVLVESILAMPSQDRLLQEHRLREKLLSLPWFAEAQALLLYARAFPEEVDLGPLIDRLLQMNRSVILPRVDPLGGRLRLFEIKNVMADLRPGVRGIPEPGDRCREVEPESVDWALVPGLGFDDRCFRLGRGAGHYDRLLPLLGPRTPRWAVGFECQLFPELPVESHDVPVDGILLPGRIIDRAGQQHRSQPPETSTSMGTA